MTLSIDIREESGVRYLHFGSDWVQGAMRLAAPDALELHYTREMMAGLLLRDAPWPRRVLMIGLGAASMVRYFHHHFPRTVVDVVEIDERVVMAARHFFELPEESPQLQIHIADGADFVCSKGPAYDLILTDGFDHLARSGRLAGAPYYTAARARLSDEGVMSVNLFARGFAASFARFDRTFDGRTLAFASRDQGNMIALAAAGEPVAVPVGEVRERAVALNERTGLDLRPAVARIESVTRARSGVVRL